MLASHPASMMNQKYSDLGIPNRFNLTPSRFRAHCLYTLGMAVSPDEAQRNPGLSHLLID